MCRFVFKLKILNLKGSVKHMKQHSFSRRLIAMATTALVGIGCAIPAAHAEITAYAGNNLIPSIQVYVRIDAGARFVTNIDNAQYNGGKGTSTALQGAGNDWGTSMFGITGALPLTTDTKAVYKLESGFSTTDGSFNGGKNQIFNRRAYIGLSDDRYGSLLFGKDLFIDNDIWGYDPMVQENMSTATLVYGRNWNQVNDMVEYRSPDKYQLKLGLQASFDKSSEASTPSTHLSDAYGASLQYGIGKLNLLGIYDVVKSNHGYTNLYTNSKEAIFGATYDFTPVEVYAGYEMLRAPQGSKADGGNAIANGGSNNAITPSVYATKAGMSWLGAAWTVSPKVIVRGAWYYTSINDGVGHANLVTAGTEYYFRPNMFWYGTVGEVLNHGHTQFSADIGSPAPAYNRNQFTGYSGISIAF